MPQRTIDAGPALLAGGALLLLIALFLPWWDGESAWTVFESLDLVLAGLAGCAIAAAAGRLGDDARVAIVLAAAALIVVATQLIDAPPLVGAQAKLGSGAWIALAASFLMLGGALQRVARFTVSIDVQGRPDAPAPAVDADARPEPKRPVRLMTDDQRTEAMPTVDLGSEADDDSTATP